MSPMRQTPRSYLLEPGSRLPDLSHLPGVKAVVGLDESDVQETYFDTAGLALLRSGVALTRRADGAQPGWVVTLPANGGHRTAVSPLTRSRTLVPKAVRAAVTAWSLGEPLSVVVHLSRARTGHQLVGAEGVVLATVSLDDVACELVGRDAAAVSWREVVVELLDGEPELVHAMDLTMSAAGVRQTIRPRTGLDELRASVPGPDPSPRPRPKAPSGRVLHTRLVDQLQALRLHDWETRQGMEDVHDLRVALRRLSGALATWRPLVDREVTDPLRDELRWAARALGESRDAEVAATIVGTLVAAEPSRLVLGPVRRRVALDAAASRRATRRQVGAVLESQRYLDVLRSLERVAECPPWTDVASRPAREVLPRLLRKDWKRVRHRVTAARDLAGTDGYDEALHAVRKAAKRLRYAAEAAEPVLGADAYRLARRAKKVQASLGRHHDTVVARSRLVDLAGQALEAGESSFSYGRLHDRLEAEAEGHLRSFERAIRRLPKPHV